MSRRCIPGKVHYFYFTTRTTAGVPATLTGATIKAYNITATTTEFTTGITLSADYDGKTGLNQVAVDMTDATAYPFSEDFALFISAGTVNSVSVVAEVVAEFNTRLNNEGVVQSGVAAASSSTTQLVCPTGRFAGITVGMICYVDGIGARYITSLTTTNSANDTLNFTTAFSATTLSVFFRVFVAAPGETTLPVPADVRKVGGTAQTAGDLAALIAGVPALELATGDIQSQVTAALTAFPVAKPTTKQGQG